MRITLGGTFKKLKAYSKRTASEVGVFREDKACLELTASEVGVL
jgi:hypothetical protein